MAHSTQNTGTHSRRRNSTVYVAKTAAGDGSINWLRNESTCDTGVNVANAGFPRRNSVLQIKNAFEDVVKSTGSCAERKSNVGGKLRETSMNNNKSQCVQDKTALQSSGVKSSQSKSQISGDYVKPEATLKADERTTIDPVVTQQPDTKTFRPGSLLLQPAFNVRGPLAKAEYLCLNKLNDVKTYDCSNKRPKMTVDELDKPLEASLPITNSDDVIDTTCEYEDEPQGEEFDKEFVGRIHRRRLLCRLCSMKTICSMKTLKKRLPCVEWIPKYRWAQLKGDVVSGLTTGLAVLPQGLAYGQIVELPAQYGLYSSFMGSFAYAVFGTSKDVAVGPSAIVSILTAQYGTGRGPITRDPTYAIILALFTGIIQSAMGLLQLGFLFNFISFPVLKAFRAAAGITIFMSRLKKWWGLPGVPREFLPQLYWSLKRIPETILSDFLLGALCLLLLYAFKRLKAMKWKRKFRDLPLHLKIIKKIYWILGTERNIIVVTFASGVVYALLLRGITVTYTGPLPSGIPEFRPPNFTLTVLNNTNFTLILPNGTNLFLTSPDVTETTPFWQIATDIGAGFFFVPLVAIFECISIGKALGRKGNYKIDYNQELIAVGVGNILCSFVSGHPVTGAFLRSGLNLNSGVKTPAGGILAGAIVLIALTVATPILSYIPTCAMAATIMMGAIDVISFHKVGFIWNTKKLDLIPWIVTFVISLTAGIEYGVFVGCGLSVLMVLYTTMRPRIKFGVEDEGDVAVVTIQPMTGLLFPAVDYLSAQVAKQLNRESNVKMLKLDLSLIVDTDTSVVQAIKILEEKCKKRGITLVLHRSQPRVDGLLGQTYLKDFCFPKISDQPNEAPVQNHHIPNQTENNDVSTRL